MLKLLRLSRLCATPGGLQYLRGAERGGLAGAGKEGRRVKPGGDGGRGWGGTCLNSWGYCVSFQLSLPAEMGMHVRVSCTHPPTHTCMGAPLCSPEGPNFSSISAELPLSMPLWQSNGTKRKAKVAHREHPAAGTR